MSQIKAELLDYMGDDLAVVDAARVSFNRDSEWEFPSQFPEKYNGSNWQEECLDDGFHYNEFGGFQRLKGGDKKLINYLAKHDHWTPFAHTALKFRCSAPVPIRTQAFKHKIGMVENEESRRYISSTPEIYIPDFFRAKPEGSIKQGSAGEHKYNSLWLHNYKAVTQQAVKAYEDMVEDGVCPEQARFILPQGAIVNWIWTGNLVSFANFYNKRTEATAQYEVRLLAESVGEKIAELFPVSWKALTGGD
jgi:thymidylate synthase (FAD)